MTQSRWAERDAQGRTLVREHGSLATVEVSATTECAGFQVSGSGTLAHGGRGYDGQSSRGAPLQTTSQIDDRHWAVEVMRPVNDRTALGARLGYREIHRDIADAGPVLGYPEVFRFWQAGLIARHELWATPAWRLAVSGEWGGGPAGRLDLRLPTADPARIRLGASRYAAASLALRSAGADSGAPGWRWQVALNYRHERLEAGEPAALFRNGVLVGGAVQPATRINSLRVVAGARYRF